MAKVAQQTVQKFPSKLAIHSNISYPVRSNDSIRTFIDGTDFFKALQFRCSNAKYSIWCGISFVSWAFKFPDGSYWWQYLHNLKQQNPSLNIRVLFWRNTDNRWDTTSVNCGNKRDWDLINKHSLHVLQSNDANDDNKKNDTAGIQFRWDESPTPSHCHHEKYFVIDAELPNNNNNNTFSFVGGMVLMNECYGQLKHDTFVEINGATSKDVISNFSLRWNNNNIFNKCIAMENCQKYTTMIDIDNIAKKNSNDNELKENDINDESSNGGIDIQLCWSCYPGIYPNYENGESSIHYLYYKTFLNAKKSIYIESQHPGELKLLEIMKWKLENNPKFKIIYIVPVHMMGAIRRAKRESIGYKKACDIAKAKNQDLPVKLKPRYHDMFEMLSSLKKYRNFCFCGMFQTNVISKKKVIYNAIYVHSKLCIVDGECFTIGSANFVDISFVHDHTELNVFVFNEQESMKLMNKLFYKHCEKDELKDKKYQKKSDVELIDFMINTARKNIKKYQNQKKLDGRLCALNPETYAS